MSTNLYIHVVYGWKLTPGFVQKHSSSLEEFSNDYGDRDGKWTLYHNYSYERDEEDFYFGVKLFRKTDEDLYMDPDNAETNLHQNISELVLGVASHSIFSDIINENNKPPEFGMWLYTAVG